MRKQGSYIFVFIFTIALFVQATGNLARGAEKSWTDIKADNLSEWSNPGNWWKTENGAFVAESKGGGALPKIHYLVWNGSIKGDFELTLKYRIHATEPQDAGFCFRVERPVSDTPNLPGYQAELDTANLYGKQGGVKKGKLFGHIHDGKRGRMYPRSNRVTIQANGKMKSVPLGKPFLPQKVFRKPPAWNDVRIVSVGNHVQLFLNGVLANDLTDDDPKGGSRGDAIGLQFRPNRAYRFEVSELKYRPADRAALSESKPAAPAPTATTNPIVATPIVDLLPASDLSNFRVLTGPRKVERDPNQVFSLTDGELLVSGTEPGLTVTRRSFTNYLLKVEYRWDTDDGKRDSGIFVNTTGPMNRFVSLECNLLGPDRGLSGELFLIGGGRKQITVNGEVKKQSAIKPQLTQSAEKPVGEWNTMEVLNDQGDFQIKVNGQEAVRGQFPTPKSGKIMFQSNRGAIRFRNARVVDFNASIAEAVALARNRQWAKSARLLQDFLDKQPVAFESGRGLWLATLYAATGNHEAHEKHCRAFFEKFSDPKSPAEGSRPAKAYVLKPGANDPELLKQALEASRFSTEEVPNNAWYTLTRGMIEYRLGKHSNVLRWLAKPLKSKHATQRTPALAFAAMTEFKQGKAARARQLLSQAEEAFAGIDPNHPGWNDIIGAKLAIDEAKALIK
ncbi:MAG: hypothetical protein ACI9VS_001266 [Candidatus Binatia bacterium]|jgi:hypothetical protein